MTENSPQAKKPTLDKDLDKIAYVEEAMGSVARGLVAPGLALLFIILVVVIATAFVAGETGAWIIVAAAAIGGYMALNIGANDVANAVGPLASVVQILHSGGDVTAHGPIPPWVMLLGATGIVAGLTMWGYRVIATIGSNITQLTPSRGFVAQLATSASVLLATLFGMPVSTTHTMVGAVLGVGVARGIGALNLRVVRHIFMSWAVTLPAGALLALAYYYLLRALIGV